MVIVPREGSSPARCYHVQCTAESHNSRGAGVGAGAGAGVGAGAGDAGGGAAVAIAVVVVVAAAAADIGWVGRGWYRGTAACVHTLKAWEPGDSGSCSGRRLVPAKLGREEASGLRKEYSNRRGRKSTNVLGHSDGGSMDLGGASPSRMPVKHSSFEEVAGIPPSTVHLRCRAHSWDRISQGCLRA